MCTGTRSERRGKSPEAILVQPALTKLTHRTRRAEVRKGQFLMSVVKSQEVVMTKQISGACISKLWKVL